MQQKRFIRNRSTDGKFYFNLHAANGEIIATSEMYESRAAMEKGIKSVKANAGRYEALAKRVERWAKNKGILEHANIFTQAQKTVEEANELLDAAKNGDMEAYKDALGDVLVTIIIGSKLANVDLLDCLADVLEIIEKRRGKIIDGQFIKDAE